MKKLISAILFFSILLTSNASYASSFVMYTAKAGDSYYKISEQQKINVNELKSLNNDDEVLPGGLVKIKPVSSNKTIKIKVNNQVLKPDEQPYIENDRTFVPIRFIAEALKVDKIGWNKETKTATLSSDSKTIELTLGSDIARVNGNNIKLDAPISIYEGRTFVPVRFISEVFKCIVSWDHDNYTVVIESDSTYAEDLYWLSRIVEAEAGAEPFEGKLAVANVIINRKNNSDFPNTIKGVIFDTNYGYQYTPVENGTIYNSPSSESIKAASLALEGSNNISDCLYFLNPRKSTNFWIIENRTFYKSIGLHDFYR